MKRVLIIAAVVLVVLIAGVAGIVGYAFMGRQAITDGAEVNGVRIIKDGMVSVGIVPVGPGQVLLIDGGNDASGRAIRSELERRQLGNNSVLAIFVTHGHPDHIAAIPLFKSAQVMALDREAGLVEGTEGAQGPLPRMMPVKPTGIIVNRRLQDGETVTVGDTQVRVYAVPGHTQGSAAYLVKGVLFVGDAADASSTGAVIGAPWIFSDSQAQDRASVVRLVDRLKADGVDVKAIAFAHSGVSTNGVGPLENFAKVNR